MAVGACEVVSPDYRVAVGLEPRTVIRSELGDGTTVRPGQQLFDCVFWGGGEGWPKALCWVPET